jgi:hypothetical protein
MGSIAFYQYNNYIIIYVNNAKQQSKVVKCDIFCSGNDDDKL